MQYEKNIIKTMLLTLLLGFVVPIVANYNQSVHASTVAVSYSKVKDVSYYYNQLSLEKQNEFNQLVVEQSLSSSEQLELLQEQYTSSRQPSPRWKAWLINKAFQTAAKMAGKSASGAMINKWAMTVSGTSDSLKKGLTNFLVDLGVNRNVAKGIAAAAMFVAF